MKLFLKRVFRFIILLFLLLIIKNSIIERNISNQLYVSKFADYTAKTEFREYNSLFFGSSRIYRHIDSEYFDSLNVEKNITSYNLGTPATFNPELYYLYELFLDKYERGEIADVLSYAIIELQTLNILTYENAVTKRGSYWNTFENYLYSIKYISTYNRPIKLKIKLIISYTVSYLTGISKYYMKLANESDNLLIMNQGFLSLEREVKLIGRNTLSQRNLDFKENPEKLIIRLKNVTTESLNEYKNGIVISPLAKKVNHLIQRSNKMGIQLFFIIPPRQGKDTYIDLLPLEKLFPNNIINLADISSYPELYEMQNSFDVGHLNDNGTKFFTKYLSDNFKKLY